MTGNHPAALLRRLNPYCARALDAAASLCQTRAHAEITIEHWLLKLLEQGEGDITVIARRYEWDIDTLWQSLLAHLDTLPRPVRERPQLSEPLAALIRQAWLIASLEGDDPQIRSQHLLMALTEKPMLPACNNLWVLLSLSRVQLERLRPLLDAQSDECPARQPQVTEPLTSAQPGAATTDAPAKTLTGKQDDALLAVLNRFTEDVTEKARSGRIDPAFGRDTEIRQMVDILSRRRKNNPILVGEPGVGKTALVEGLALRITEGNVPDSLKTVHIRTLDLGLLQAGAGVKGEFEQRLKNVIDAVQKSPEPVLLFIDEAHTIIGAGNQAGGADAANLLKPALARGELRTIAATTWSEYKQYFERDAALERRFQMVKVDEPDDDTACLMLRGLKARYAQHHGVHMLDSAIQTAVRLSRRYLTGRQLPDKAVDLLDTAGARVRMSLDTLPEPLTQLHARLAALDIEREAIEQDSVFYPETSPERLAELTDLRDELQAEAGHLEAQYQQEKALAQQIMTLRQEGTDSSELQQQLRTHQGFAPLLALDVDARAVATVVADWTGIPLSSLLRDEQSDLLSMEQSLENRVVGQSPALCAIAQRLRAAKTGLTPENGPQGVFLLTGPSGTGKTETALTLADTLFGGEKSLITINLSEYQEPHTVSQLKGSPPGYVGYGQGGVLTEAVRKRPYSVVLLDEVEKAHRDVMNLFYQVFDRGFMRDGEGRVQGMPVQTALRTLHGVITGFKHLSSSQDEARYEVRLKPRMALLARSRQNAIYQNLTVPQIVEKILRERHQMRGQDFVFNLKSEYPSREQVMQYGEDDLTFVSRLLSEVGIWFRFATDARLKIEVVEFYDDQSGYERGLTLPLRHPSGLFDGETEAVWGLNTAYSVVEKNVTTRDYNYRTATAEMMTEQHDATGGDNTTYGEAYHYADNFLQKGDKEAAESGAFYARIRHERYLNEQAILKGQSTSSLLMPGLEIRVQGDDAPAVFRKGVLITGVTASAARDRSYELTFTAIPYSERYGYRPALIPRPVMAGTLPARVTSTVKNDIYAHIDKDGRYRVNLDFDRDTWKPGYESLWVRQSRPYAGDTYGLHLPLLAGTEVSIAFEEGNPDRPYIAGVKHDSAHTDHVTIQNYKRNVLRTPANNKIRLDDERGKEHIKVSTEYGGKSQLNLGHLVDAGKQQRGEGFELRTDLWGAVRAKKGIFISADAQDKAQGQVREMADIISELNSLSDKIQKLSDDAATANADPADMAAQVALITSRINDLTTSVILMHAPKGVAVASGEHLQLAAVKNLQINAGNNADIGVVKNMFIGVGRALSVFVRKAGIRLIANKGAVSVQAQHDLMELLAKKSIEIVSTEDEIKITAKKKITINGGGSYIRIEGSGIEPGTPGDYNVKAVHYGRQPKASEKVPMPEFPILSAVDSSDFCLECLLNAIKNDDAVVEGV
ncbi:TPA: type VI secretion system ATPase TssH [Escherichia coli]